MKDIFKAIAAFQSEVPVIHESTKGYNYTYADLTAIFEVIKPLLTTHGLGFTQVMEGNSIKTIVFHVDSGETLEGSIDIDLSVNLGGMNKYQTLGSAITYYRRYQLSCMLGLITDKDIDAKGEEVKPAAKKEPVKKAKQKFKTKDGFKKVLESSADMIEKALKLYELTEDQNKQLTDKLNKLTDK